MRTTIFLDPDLVKRAFRLSQARTKKALVHEALLELVRMRRRRPLKDLKGKIRFREGYDYKSLREGR